MQAHTKAGSVRAEFKSKVSTQVITVSKANNPKGSRQKAMANKQAKVIHLLGIKAGMMPRKGKHTRNIYTDNQWMLRRRCDYWGGVTLSGKHWEQDQEDRDKGKYKKQQETILSK